MGENYNMQLEGLLEEKIVSAKTRAAKAFDELESRIAKHGLVLFGGGVFSKKILAGLRKTGIEPLGFADNNSAKWNTEVEGLKIFSPEQAAKNFPSAIFMVTIWSDAIGHPVPEITAQLNAIRNTEVVSFFELFWKYPELYLPYFSIETPDKTLSQTEEIRKCFNLFKDEESRREFCAQIRWRLTGDYSVLGEPGEFTQYFYDDLFRIDDNDVFVDCGAFDGDTMKNFLKHQQTHFKHYYALEPDPINCDKLREFVKTLPSELSGKITVKQCAVADVDKKISFSSDGSLQSSISDTGNIQVDCISIDKGLNGAGVSYIKMDTEGSEPDILNVAAGKIRAYKPILAISVYHQYDHLWKLPLQAKAILDEYEFFLRPHCKASWDLIVYAIPKNRLRIK